MGKEIQGTWSPGGRHATEQQREPSYTKKQHEPPGCRGQQAAAGTPGPPSSSSSRRAAELQRRFVFLAASVHQ